MQEKWIKILCGKLYTGLEAKLSEHAEVLVHGKYIEDVGFHLDCPEETQIIDLSHLTVTPGLIDAHVHPEYFNWRDVYSDTIYNSDGYRTLATYCTAKRALHGGFTTIRSMGWFRESYELDVKRAINEGYLPGARMIVAPHLLGTTGSHGDMTQIVRTNPILCDFMEKLSAGIGNGPDFFTAAVRREKKLGADFIKIMATGGFASPYDDPGDCQLDDEELKAIIDTAGQLRRPVTAHAYTAELAKNLIRMGINGIEHGSLIDEETCDMMLEKGVYLCCTFQPYEEAVHMDEEKLAKKSIHFQRKLLKYGDQLRATRELVVKKILEEKMTIGYGTDMVSVYDNFECWREFATWRKSGIPALRTLKAATSVNAKILGSDEIGILAPGKIADISGWSRDIENDVEAISVCDFVMTAGIVYKQ